MTKSRLPFFLMVLLPLFLYTGVKASQIMPDRSYFPWVVAALYMALIISWQFVYRSDAAALDQKWFRVLAWTGSLGMGLWATFLIFSIPVDVGSRVYALIQRFPAATEIDPVRRDLISRWLSLGLLGISGGVAGFGFVEAVAGPRIKEVTVPVRNLPSALVGLRIAQISDLHVGPTIKKGYVEEVVRKSMALKPDLIAVTGDLVDGTPEFLGAHVDPLSKLKAPLGTYYITGNHEYYWGVENWLKKVATLGFIPLLNENRNVSFNGTSILVGGVTDKMGGQFSDAHRSDPHRAIQSTQSSQFKLLLAHRPDSCFEAEPAGFDLQLSGHTHAGQFFPWSIIVRLAHKYYRGLNKHGKMWVYISAGTGYWGPAHRFLVPSEITLIKLAAA